MAILLEWYPITAYFGLPRSTSSPVAFSDSQDLTLTPTLHQGWALGSRGYYRIQQRWWYATCRMRWYDPVVSIMGALLISFGYSMGSQLLCREQSCGGAHVVRNWSFQPTAVKELSSLANSHMNELRRSSTPDKPLYVCNPQPTTSVKPYERPEPESPSKATPGFLTLGNCEMIHVCCDKL